MPISGQGLMCSRPFCCLVIHTRIHNHLGPTWAKPPSVFSHTKPNLCVQGLLTRDNLFIHKLCFSSSVFLFFSLSLPPCLCLPHLFPCLFNPIVHPLGLISLPGRGFKEGFFGGGGLAQFKVKNLPLDISALLHPV